MNSSFEGLSDDEILGNMDGMMDTLRKMKRELILVGAEPKRRYMSIRYPEDRTAVANRTTLKSKGGKRRNKTTRYYR